MEKATFAGGCFWCTEAIFLRLRGVLSVEPGYSGGHKDNPTYEEVCSGATGHAEAVQIEFDPQFIAYSRLLEVFFATHDPTTPNQQGNDIGSQYRSVVFYHSAKQKSDAENFIQQLEKSKVFTKPIVTTIESFKKFFVAEEYHKNYYERNKDAMYCSYVIGPKISKLLKEFGKDVKEDFKNELLTE